jgi:hypothetical protein
MGGRQKAEKSKQKAEALPYLQDTCASLRGRE